MFNETPKIALVTGSAKRIGKFLIEKLSLNGWSIALHYNNSEKEAYDTARTLLTNTNVMLFKADLTKLDQVENLVDQVNQQLGPISLLINNASILKNDTLLNLDTLNFEENLSIHLKAPLFLAKKIAETGIKADIINLVDTSITQNSKNFFSYSLTKKTLATLTQMLALSLAPDIKVNAIALGPILFKDGQNYEVFEKLQDESPLKNTIELDEIYQTIEFILKSASITGQVVYLDNGRHLI